MSADTHLPKLWLSFSKGSSVQIDGGKDCDCSGGACPDPVNFEETRIPPLVQLIANGGIQNVQISDDIFVDYLDNYTIVLAATGDHIVVFNEQATTMLARVANLTSINELKLSTAWPEKVLDQFVAILLAERILSSPELDLDNFKQSDSDTLTAWLHLTNGCNLSCSYCFLNLNGRHMDAATVHRAVESIFKSAQSHNYSRVRLKYAGGEPTLNFKSLLAAQQHAEMLSAETNISLETVMLTNGIRLNDNQIEELLSHNIHVSISLDGIGEFHDIQRPTAGSDRGSFELVSKTVEHLLDCGISPHISVTITNRNILGLPDLVSYLLTLNVRFSLNFYREPEDLPVFGELSFGTREMIDGLKSVYRVIEEHLPSYSLLGNLTDRVDLRFPHSHTCGVGKNYLVVNYDGNIAKCQMDMAFPITTINIDDPLAVIQSDTKGILNLNVDQKDLRKCVWRYRCSGGCPRLVFQRTGRYDSKSPMCEIYEGILPDVVRLEALRLIRYELPVEFQ